MKFTYSKHISVSIEDELPVLGYDLKHGARSLFEKEMNEAIRIAIKDGREEQTIDFGSGNVYKVSITDNLHSLQQEQEDGIPTSG